MLDQWRQLLAEKLSSTADLQTPNYFDLSSYGVISLEGDDTKRFLQGQITADIEQISTAQAGLSALCTPQGRMRSLFLLVSLSDNRFFCLLPQELLQPTLETLSKFAVFYKTTLKDVSAEWVVLGKDAEKSQPLSVSIASAAVVIDWYGNRQIHLEPITTAFEALKNNQNKVLNYQEWLVKDIISGVPRLYSSTIDTFLPHNLNLPELFAVSFNKGCYTGQEVVARMHYKGKLKSHMRYLQGAGTDLPEPGSSIMADDRKMGEVICAASDGKSLHVLALCKDVIESATKIQCELENVPILELRN